MTENGRRILARLGWGHRGFRVRSGGAALLALCLLLALPFIGDQIAFQQRMRWHNPDLRGWLANAVELAQSDGRTFYAANPFYIYPPFFLTLIWPLTKLPAPAAAAVFETAKWIALVVALRLAWRLCSRPGEDLPPIVALGSLLCTWRFIDNDFGMGNINVLLLCMVLGGCWLATRGRWYAAGAIIAVAAAVKLTPALLLVYWAYKGWWRTWVGAAAGLLVCLVIWPAVWLGWEQNLQLLGGWYNAVVAGFVTQGAVRSEHTNQALVGILNRLFGPTIDAERYVQVTLIELSAAARNGLRLALSAGVLGVLAWACRGRGRVARRPLAHAAELGLVFIGMLLLSGLSWKAHFVTLLLPYSVLLTYLADARHSRRRRVVGVSLAISFALCTLTSDIITPAGANYAEALGLIALGAVAAGAGLVAVCGTLRAEAPEPQDGGSIA